jgi:valyl-tRNA synthetase
LALQLPEIDRYAVRHRLQKENEKLEKVIVSTNTQLESEKFLNSAPPHIVESMRAKLADYRATVQKNKDTLNGL